MVFESKKKKEKKMHLKEHKEHQILWKSDI